MTFGLAIIGATRGKSRGPQGRKYDCGKHGKLTTRQIATAAGISIHAARHRVNVGMKGEALVAPRWESLRNVNKAKCRRPSLLTACRIARAFPDRVPTIKELQAVYPMSHASALRWRQGWRDTLEKVA